MERTFLVYNGILLLTILFSILIEKSRSKTAEYTCRTLLFLSQAIPACIRKGIGTDYWGYIALYKIYKHGSDKHEIGFQYIGKFLHSFDADPQIFIGVISALVFFFIAYFIPKRKYTYFSVIFFLSTYAHIISTSRQYISIAIMSCGIVAMNSKRGNLKYLLSAAGAYLLHYSSMLYFPLLLFKKIKLTAKGSIISLGALLLICFSADLIPWILKSSMFQDSVYEVYVGTEYMRAATVNSGLGIIANILLPFLFLITYSKSSRYIDNPGFFCILALLFIGSYILASQIHIFGRLMGVFKFVPAFLAYPTCKAISKRYPWVIFIGFLLLYIILFEKLIIESQISLHSGLGISPYKTIFD